MIKNSFKFQYCLNGKSATSKVKQLIIAIIRCRLNETSIVVRIYQSCSEDHTLQGEDLSVQSQDQGLGDQGQDF